MTLTRPAGPGGGRLAGQGPIPAAPVLLMLIALVLSFVCATNFPAPVPVFPAVPAFAVAPLSMVQEAAAVQVADDSRGASATQNSAAPASVASCAINAPAPGSAREQAQPVQLADAPPLSAERSAPGILPGAMRAIRARAPNAPSLTQLSISRT